MGVDLTLLPLLSKDNWVAHTQIVLERRSELWDPFIKLKVTDIPQPLRCYLSRGPEGEACYGPVESDQYGGRLNWATASAITALRDHEGVQDNEINKAAWAYLAELPPDWPVVLYWH